MRKALYLIAVCSNSKIKIPGNSVLIDTSLRLLSERDEECAKQIEKRDAQLAAILGSHSWKLTQPLRFLIMSVQRIIDKFKIGRG